MTTTKVLETMRSALQGISDTVDWDTITAEDHLQLDLGFDSLTMMLVSLQLEDTFQIEISDNENFVTVGDVCQYITKKRTESQP